MADRVTLWKKLATALGLLSPDNRLRAVVREQAQRKRAGLAAGRPLVAAGAWRYEYNLHNLVGRRTGAQAAPLSMLRYMRDYNPDAAQAVWQMIRLATKLDSIEVHLPDSEDTDEQGQALLEALDRRVAQEYGGGLRSLASVLTLTLLTQGAAALEVGLTEDLRDVLGIFPVDPGLIGFQWDENRVPHPVLNTMAGEPTRLNEAQFRYFPLDPDVDEPIGRSPMWPALEAIEFQTEVLRDLRAVAHNQGYPRIDVSVLEEIVLANVPAHLKEPGREEELRAWVDAYLTDLQSSYESLKPDDTFIHWDWVKQEYIGPGSAGSLDLDTLIAAVDAQVIAALKTLPILLGRNEGATTTHATVQWQIYADSVEAVQELARKALEWACNVCLQVWGRQAVCELAFEAPRKSDRLADAQAEKLETETWIRRMLAGWVTSDEAAQALTGHDAVALAVLPELQGMTLGAEEPEPEGEETELTDEDLLGEEEQGRAVGGYDEGLEWLQTPNWMQALLRENMREFSAVTRNIRAQKREAFAAVPAAEWAEAEAKDAEAGRGNGHR